MLAYYGTDISPNQTETREGYLICRNVPIARTGPQEYLARELGLDGDPERAISVNRLPEDVFEAATLASFEGKPVTDGHPPENVGAENYSAYSRGHVQNVRRDGDFIVADLYINDANLASDVRNGVKREVSCGYQCDYEPDGDTYRQTHIRGNHVAVVPRGRAGHDVAIQDQAAEPAKKGKNAMKEWQMSLLKTFGMAARDAADEDVEKMAHITGLALDAEPAEKAQEAEPAADEATEEQTETESTADGTAADEAAADEVVYKEQKGVDLGTKIDKVLSLLEKMAGGEDKEPTPGEKIDALLNEMGDKAVTVSEDACNTDVCAPNASRDAAVELLKALRPVVASMQDKTEQKRVTDALVSVIRGDGAVMGKIAQAAQDSAAKAAKQTSKTSYEQICEEAQNAYDACNPHRRKEGA